MGEGEAKQKKSKVGIRRSLRRPTIRVGRGKGKKRSAMSRGKPLPKKHRDTRKTGTFSF